jgi:hypothetical protein
MEMAHNRINEMKLTRSVMALASAALAAYLGVG